MNTIITGDVSWVYGYHPETKSQSSFSLQWKSDESTKHYITQRLLAINWRSWQAEKNCKCVWRFKVASCKHASLKPTRFSQKKHRVGYFSLTERYNSDYSMEWKPRSTIRLLTSHTLVRSKKGTIIQSILEWVGVNIMIHQPLLIFVNRNYLKISVATQILQAPGWAKIPHNWPRVASPLEIELAPFLVGIKQKLI